MSKKKQELGKGLRALLTNIDNVDSKPKKKKKVVTELSKTVAEISTDKIEANPFQPRVDFNKVELEELVQSIKTLGLIQPITVRRLGEDSYQIISGERRWRASKLAGLKKIPAYIRIADDQGMLEMALVENIQRSNLNPLEVALSYQRLIDECDLQHDEMAERVGKERSTITNYIRLLKLPPDIQSELRAKKLSMGHARALLGLEDAAQQLIIFKRIKEDGLSVRKTEDLVRSIKSPAKSSLKPAPNRILHPEVRKIREALTHHLGCKVDIARSSRGKGKIVLHFNSDDELNDIVDLIQE
ncbi:MAG: ParB/RepB/Spo0J family partition protein [Saprospiraceae bacterium]|nr:ParB/RepB/Spo0J family partition protein [Bacteroidia bacterium]NNE14962.1 ParB/RepB/Spo0J family partition protein [Saprospiraceae bacterium]NNL92200.1 ParB/RepB/Spo0J family partition protein [Saprospiraceae bacterium]